MWPGVDVIADGSDLVLNGSTSITAQMPGNLKSLTHNILLTRPLTIFRNNSWAEFSIQAYQDFTCTNTINLVDEGTVNTTLEIFAGTIEIDYGCYITADHPDDTVHMKPTCIGTNCRKATLTIL